MKWTSNRSTFRGAAGTKVVCNLDPLAWVIIDASSEVLQRAVAKTISRTARKNRFSKWASAINAFPRSGVAADVELWLGNYSVAIAEAGWGPSPWIALLSYLRLEGALLWPSAQHILPFPGYPHFEARVPVFRDHALTNFEKDLLRRHPHHSSAAKAILLALSPLGCPEDIHESAFLAVLDSLAEQLSNVLETKTGLEQVRERKNLTGQCKSINLMALFRSAEGLPRKEGVPVQIVAAAEKILRSHDMRGRKSVRWGEYSTDPRARVWIEPYERYTSTQTNKRLVNNDDVLLRFLDYFAEQGTILAPKSIKRSHIFGAAGFLDWLERRYGPSSEQPSRIIGNLRRFFDWQSTEWGLPNPIQPGDIAPKPPRNNKSTKVRTPRDVIQEARNVVRELIAFAHAQSCGDTGPPFGSDDTSSAELPRQPHRPSIDDNPWAVDATTAKLLPESLRRPSNFVKHLVKLRNADGTVRTVLSPVMPTLLLLLLTIPLRGLQARLLDSGEGDEFRSHITTSAQTHTAGRLSHAVSFEWTPNPHPLATKSRRQGVIRRYVDGDNDGFLGLYVNTNKTQAPGDKARDLGYEIPWQHPELLDRLHRLRAWQERYNPADRFLTLKDVGELESRLTPSPALGSLPGHVFIFRQYDDRNLSYRQWPATENNCITFFLSILDEVEARLQERVAAENAVEPGCKKHRQPPVLILNRDGPRPIAGVYTLHSLRITGITAFAEAGVPAPIIAEYLSGHLTVLMAIYYMKFGPATMTKVLAEAEQLIESGILQDATHDAARSNVDLLIRSFVSEDEIAFQSSRDELPGFWKWSIDGICPNGMTRCDEGGPRNEDSRSGTFAQVEGGARNCPMCRFWLTGPRFVAGQIIMANATLHRARSLSKTLQGLWEQKRDPAKVRRLAWTNDRIDKVEAEINVVLRTLNARVRLLEKSLALARQQAEPDTPEGTETGATLDLITRMQDTDVHITARQTSELGYLEFMSRAVRLFPEIDAHDAPIELGGAIDRLLDDNHFRGMLYKLPSDLRADAGIAFMDCIRSQAPADVPEDEFVDQVANGQRRLFNFDVARIEAEMSRAAGRAMLLEPILGKGDAALQADNAVRMLEHA